MGFSNKELRIQTVHRYWNITLIPYDAFSFTSYKAKYKEKSKSVLTYKS